MANKLKEVRVRFSDEETELFNYITSKRSAAGFLKDLATVEMKREKNQINNISEIALEVLKLLISNNLNLSDLIKAEEIAASNETIEIDKTEDFKEYIEDEFDD